MRPSGGLLVLLLLSGPVLAAEPVVSSLMPRGGRRGTEVLLQLDGRRLADAAGLLFHGRGLEVLEMKAAGERAVQFRVRIAEDCPLGRHVLRLRTRTGLSNFLTFHVGVLPEVVEVEPNDDVARAQTVPLDTTVNGRIPAEDVDVFRIEIPAGTRVAFEVEGIRLGGDAFDPRLSVLDAEGREVLLADDGAFGRMDPVAEHRFETGGTYLVRIREAAWGGGAGAHYRLHVGRFPRPRGVLPAGGRPGETLAVALIDAEGARTPATVTIPAHLRPGDVFRWFPEGAGGTSPTPLWLLVSDLAAAPEPAARAPKERGIAVPGAVDGVISAPDELDVYTFDGKRGQRLEVRVHARELRSPLDPVAQVVDPRGRNVRFNDDNGGPDSRFSVRLPQDGTYTVRLRDHLRRGGPRYFYRLELGPARSPLQARVINPRRRDLSAIAVPRGGHLSVLLRGDGVPRSRLLELVARDLPPGVEFETVPFMRETGQLPVIFSAAADAPLGGAMVALDAVAPEGGGEAFVDRFRQRLPLVYVRNDQVYLEAEVDRIPVAVTEAPPFTVRITPPQVPIVQGGPHRLEVTLERTAGFKGPVRVVPLWNPPGIRAGGITIPAGKARGEMPLSANGQVPPRVWKFAVIGIADVYGPLRVSSPFVDLESIRRVVSLDPSDVRGEPGAELPLEVTLKATEAFEGTARLTIENLPRDVTAAPLEVTADQEKVAFRLKLGEKAPPGRHRNLVFRMEVPGPRGPLVHTWRSGELRIDRPLPPRRAGAAKRAGSAPKPRRGTVANPKT